MFDAFLNTHCLFYSLFEPTCAYAHMNRFLSVWPSVCDWTKTQIGVKIPISATIQRRVMTLGQKLRILTWMTPRLTLRVKVIGQRSPGSKNVISGLTILQVIFEVKGHTGQGQSNKGQGRP